MSKFFKALEQAERERALGGLAERPDGPAEGKKPETAERAGPVEQADRAKEAESNEQAEGLEPITAAAPQMEAPARPSPRAAVDLEIPELGSEAATDTDAAEPHLVSLHAPTSFAAEQYRTLRHIIEHEAIQLIAVTSPGVGDGKTTTAVNLAGALAQSRDARVLLIDCDLRRPTVAKFMGLPHRSGVGLVELLLDRRRPLDSAIVTRRPYNLDILPAGAPPTNPYEVLKSPRLPLLMDEARKRYQFVILDTPPAIPLPDCRVLATVVDCFVLIVSANRTPRRLVEETLETLGRGKVLGLIFNKDETPGGGYYEYQAYFPSSNGGRKSRLARIVSQVRALRKKPASMRRNRK
jgi:capsular exopolysaccharide synthesis family protein